MKFKAPHIKKPSRPTLITFILAIVVGFLLTAQFYSVRKVAEVTDPELQKNQALEVSILAANNTDLRQEVSSLQEQQNEYDEVLQYRLAGTEALTSSLNKYKEVSGIEEISGAGVTVTIEGPALDVHVLDLLNNLRNIGARGIALNGERLIYNANILPDQAKIRLNGEIIDEPYRFDVIGDADLLASSLQREGGLLEQLSQTFPEIEVTVTKKDSLTLPAYDGDVNLKYAHAVED